MPGGAEVQRVSAGALRELFNNAGYAQLADNGGLFVSREKATPSHRPFLPPGARSVIEHYYEFATQGKLGRKLAVVHYYEDAGGNRLTPPDPKKVLVADVVYLLAR